MKIDMADFQAQIDKAIRDFQEAGVKAETAVERQLVESAIMVETDAKVFSPVDTGRLVNSITHRIVRDDGVLTAEVGTNVEYAPYQEFGTSKMKAQPFLNPALDRNQSRIEADIAAAIKGALG